MQKLINGNVHPKSHVISQYDLTRIISFKASLSSERRLPSPPSEVQPLLKGPRGHHCCHGHRGTARGLGGKRRKTARSRFHVRRGPALLSDGVFKASPGAPSLRAGLTVGFRAAFESGPDGALDWRVFPTHTCGHVPL